jgi:hypothetical protein
MSAHKNSGRRSMRIVGLRQVRPQICRIVLMVEQGFTASNLKGSIRSSPGGNDRALRLLMTPSAVNLLRSYDHNTHRKFGSVVLCLCTAAKASFAGYRLPKFHTNHIECLATPALVPSNAAPL